MTWITLKSFLKKVWVWIIHNWYIPAVIIYTLVLWIFFRRKDSAREVLKIRSESYEAQIEVINKSHAEEIEKRDEILRKYSETIKQIEEEYERKNEELDNKKRKAVKEIVEKHYNDPDTLAKMIGKRFGFEYTEDE